MKELENTNVNSNRELNATSNFEEEKEKIVAEYNKTHDLTNNIQVSKEMIKNNSKESSLESIVRNNYQEKTIVDMKIPVGNRIGIASDHRGYKLKQKLTKYLTKKGYTVIDYGCDDQESHDYPEYGFILGKAIRDQKVEKGIVIKQDIEAEKEAIKKPTEKETASCTTPSTVSMS